MDQVEEGKLPANVHECVIVRGVQEGKIVINREGWSDRSMGEDEVYNVDGDNSSGVKIPNTWPVYPTVTVAKMEAVH